MTSTSSALNTPFETPAFEKKRVGTAVVLGAGPTGLSTAWRLVEHGWKVHVIEKSVYLGGHGSTRTLHGYDVDDGPHKLYPQVSCAMPLIEHFVPKGELLTTSKKSTIYVRGKYIPFPFGIGDLFKGLGIKTGVLCGMSYVLGKLETLVKGKPKNYSDFVTGTYGRYANKLVFRQVAEKLWGNPDHIHVQLAKTRIIAPNLWQLVAGMLLGFKKKPSLSADEFYYPRKGLKQLWESMGTAIEAKGGEVHRESLPSEIQKQADGTFKISFSGKEEKRELTAEVVISTIPIKTNVELLKPLPSDAVKKAAHDLQLSSLLVLYVVVKKARILPVNWIFFPEDRYHFARISEQKGFSESMIPADRTVLMVEIPYARTSIASRERENVIQEAIAQLKEVHILSDDDEILETFTGFGREIYPIYDLGYQKNLETILKYTDSIADFYLNGRLGLFCYNNMDHSMEMGLTLADHIAQRGSLAEWKSKRALFYDYKIVD